MITKDVFVVGVDGADGRIGDCGRDNVCASGLCTLESGDEGRGSVLLASSKLAVCTVQSGW